jgi:hypothetical protein
VAEENKRRRFTKEYKKNASSIQIILASLFLNCQLKSWDNSGKYSGCLFQLFLGYLITSVYSILKVVPGRGSSSG